MPPIDFDQFSPEESARLDEACDAFESAWKQSRSGKPQPSIADFLEGFSGTARLALAQELAGIDRACRNRFGIPPSPDETSNLLVPQSPFQTRAPGAALSDLLLKPENWPNLPGLQIEKVLGSGGMGIVFLARQKALDRNVAVKLLRDAEFATDKQRERFQQEAKAIARLKHPNLVQVYELGEITNSVGAQYPYLVLEYVPGGNLSEIFHGQPQPFRESAFLLKALAHAVHYAHEKGIVHRDLKPANILIQKIQKRENENFSAAREQQKLSLDHFPKITDFGLAKFLSDSRQTTTRTLQGTPGYNAPEQIGANLTVTQDVIGTPCYMAPEQGHEARKDVGPTADVYALGAILYESLTGKPPFLGSSPFETLLLARTTDCVPIRKLQPKVPKDLETICLKCLSKEPHRRYQTALELADELDRFLEGKPIKARPVGVTESVWRWCKRQPVLATVTGSFLVTIIGFNIALILLFLHAKSEKDRADRNLAKAKEVVEIYLTSVEKDPRLVNSDLISLRKDLLKAAIPYFEDFANSSSGNQEFTRDKISAMFRLANLYNQTEEIDKAMENNTGALELATSLLQTNPNDINLALTLSKIWSNRSILLEKNQKMQESTEALENALKIISSLHKKQPNNIEIVATIATIHHNLGVLYSNENKWVESENSLLNGLEVLKSTSPDPLTLPMKRMEGLIYLAYGQMQARKKDGSSGFGNSLKGLEILQKLAAENPEDLLLQIDSIRTAYPTALAQFQAGFLSEGEKTLRQALATIDKLALKVQSLPNLRENQANLSALLGENLAKQGRGWESYPVLEMGILIREDLAARFPDRPQYRQAIYENYNTKGDIYQTFRKLDESVEAYRKGQEQVKILIRQNPGNKTYRFYEMTLLNKILSVLLKDKKNLESLTVQKELVKVNQAYINDFSPTTKVEKASLAEKYYALGDQLQDFQKYEEAVEAYVKSREYYSRALEEDKDYRNAISMTTRTWMGQGTALIKLKKYSEAILALDQAIPQTGVSRAGLRVQKSTCLIRLGKIQEGLAEIDEVAKTKTMPIPLWYQMAASLGIAAGKSTTPEREQIAKKAIDFLNKGKSGGHFREASRVDSFHKDPDFDGLRSVDAFKAWEDKLTVTPADPPTPVKPSQTKPAPKPENPPSTPKKTVEGKRFPSTVSG